MVALSFIVQIREATQVVVPNGSTSHSHGLSLASTSEKLCFEAGQEAFVGD